MSEKGAGKGWWGAPSTILEVRVRARVRL